MARISCEMIEPSPGLLRRYTTAQPTRPDAQQIWTLLIQTDAGLLDLEITPEQGRAIARALVHRFGQGEVHTAVPTTQGDPA